MVIVEQGHRGSPANKLLREMFEERKSVFVDLLKWDVPVLDGRFEIDQFDDEHATYLILANAAGCHCGSARLLPTTRPGILGSLFAGLCAGPPPAGPGTFEITRFCLSRRLPARTRLKIRNRLVSSLVAHALDAGISTYTCVADMAWLQRILAFGWDCRPLGPPALLECGMLGALAIEITAETPALLAANGLWVTPDAPAAPIAEAA